MQVADGWLCSLPQSRNLGNKTNETIYVLNNMNYVSNSKILWWLCLLTKQNTVHSHTRNPEKVSLSKTFEAVSYCSLLSNLLALGKLQHCKSCWLHAGWCMSFIHSTLATNAAFDSKGKNMYVEPTKVSFYECYCKIPMQIFKNKIRPH